VDEMVKRGLVAEVEKLIATGYDLNLPAMSSIGYRQIGKYISGQMSLDEAVQQMKYETHRYIRQQYLWFRLKDDRIHWFNISNDIEADIMKLVADFLKKPEEIN
jgi:tRNA dimethylallyltransferase